MKKLSEKSIESVYGGGHIDLILFPKGNTKNDPRNEKPDVFFKVTHFLGYAVYNDNDEYMGGFSTGHSEPDLADAIKYAREIGITNPEIYTSFNKKR